MNARGLKRFFRIVIAFFGIASLEGHVYFFAKKFLCSAQSACASSFSRTIPNTARAS